MARRRAGERFVKDAPYDVRDKDAEIRAATSYVPRKSSRSTRPAARAAHSTISAVVM